ncbi:hypothetical protein [Mycolicibacterium sp.]|uniref:hypothetical protein n=1 Tax=Mycolicibacterium sp. TaxID=2320850 RepID=UPI00355F33E1
MASFLDLFSATDSDGASAAKYKLHYLGNHFVNQDSWVFGMAVQLIFTAFKMMAVPANALLGLVLSSGSWLDPLAEGYQQLLEPLFRIFPPWLIACLGLGIVAVSMLMSRPSSTASGLLNSDTLNRVGTALAMVIAVMVLTYNPFALVSKVLELANGFSVGLAAAVTGSAHNTTTSAGQALVDASIRTPAIALNYGREFTADCKSQWSQAMLSGQSLSENSGCFVEGQNLAGPDTVGTALFMLLLPALPMLAFSIIAAWKYVLHLSMAVICTLATGWVAAINVHRRRGFDRLSQSIALAGAHLLMAVVVSMVSVALPALCAGLATELLGLVSDAQAQAFALMLALGIGFAVSTWVLFRVTGNTSALVRVLHADANSTMEKVLGVTPKPVKLGDLGVAKFNPFTAPAPTPDAPPARNKPSPLADDPVATTRSATAIAEAADRPKGTEIVNNQITASDAAAVTQLTAAAVTVAEASGNTATAQLVVAQPAEAESAPAHRSWQLELDGSSAVPGRDVFGYFAIDTAARPNTVAGEAVDTHAPVSATPAGPPASGPDPTSAAPADVSPLAQPDRSVLRTHDDAAAPPVPGNVYADPALDSAARAVGATFTASVRGPVGRRLLPWMRGFTGEHPPNEPVPFAVPEVAQGRPLTLATATVNTAPAPGASAPDAGAGSVAVNDQQRWNRLSQRLRQIGGTRPVTSPEPAMEQPASGIGPGTNTHPGSFCAPLPDFLAGEALEAEMDEISTAMAAAGRPVRVALSPEDRRVGVRLSSDPDERVVTLANTGFGDPA